MKKLEAKKIFNGQCEFMFGAHNFSQVPESHFPEIAFIGSSNVGKSSLINAIIGKKIAIVSSTPGRTRQLNFFKVPSGFKDGFVIVDMPGYGFAKADNKDISHWQRTSFEYLTNRPNLKRVFLLIDPIKGLKDPDRDMINIFNSLAVSFQILLTKSDKLKRETLVEVKEKIGKEAEKWPAVFPKIVSVSSLKGYNIDEVQNQIVETLQFL